MAKSILITGASSGIGKALAYELASRGYALALASRRIDVLEQIKDYILNKHPNTTIEIRALDVTNYEAVPAVINDFIKALGGLDIVFANAGVSIIGKVGQNNFEKTKQNIETNLIGTIATVDAAVSHFLEQGYGHIVGVTSVAAFRGMPCSSVYCASKSGFATYLEALRAEVLRKKINVTVLYPGYIDTPLNDMMKSRPFLISVEKGASIIARLIIKKVKSSTVPPFPWNLIGPILKLLPTRIISRMG